jgi:hypothetical protein
MSSLQVVRPPIRTYSGSMAMPFISWMPEISMTGPTTGRSTSAGKKSVPPARIFPPEPASMSNASRNVFGRKYKGAPTAAPRDRGRTQFLYKPTCLYRVTSGLKEDFAQRRVGRQACREAGQSGLLTHQGDKNTVKLLRIDFHLHAGRMQVNWRRQVPYPLTAIGGFGATVG